MQTIAINWTVFSLTIIALALFGILYAILVNWLAKKQVTGQTAYLVVGGVGMALVASVPTFGLEAVAISFAYFTACGLPMVIEYNYRVHQERRRDVQAAQALAKEAINPQADAHDEPA